MELLLTRKSSGAFLLVGASPSCISQKTSNLNWGISRQQHSIAPHKCLVPALPFCKRHYPGAFSSCKKAWEAQQCDSTRIRSGFQPGSFRLVIQAASPSYVKGKKPDDGSRGGAARALNELTNSTRLGPEEELSHGHDNGGGREDDNLFGGGANIEKVEFLRRQEYLPIQRSYRNDLCTLTLRGGAPRDKVLQALAADGQTAMDAVEYGEEVISFELLFPAGNNDDGGPQQQQRKGPMIMTKLMAPTDMVLDMQTAMRRQRDLAKLAGRRSAKQIRPQEMGTRLRNRLFKQLVLEKLGDFVLRVHQPGSRVDWTTLAEPKTACEVEGDARLGSALVAAVADYALSAASAAKSASRQSSSAWGGGGRRPRWRAGGGWGRRGRSAPCPSAEAPVRIYTLDVNEAVASAESSRRLAAAAMDSGEKEDVSSSGSGAALEAPVPSSWWPNPARAGVARRVGRLPGGGPQLGPEQLWLDQNAEVYCLVVDLGRVSSSPVGTEQSVASGARHEGRSGRSPWGERGDVGTLWEARMTHAQMIDLAAALDMFQLDVASFPEKPPLPRPSLKFERASTGQMVARAVSLLAGCASIAIVVGAATYARLRGPSPDLAHLSPTSSLTALQAPRGQTRVLLPINGELTDSEMEGVCRAAVLKAAQAFYPEAMVPALESSGAVVWIGRDLSALAGSTAGTDAEKKSILEYQVVVTRGGEVVGFMPANSTAVSKWALWPFATDLHAKKGPRDFAPGVFEPKLKWKGPPDSAIAIHLLALHEPSSTAITAKPWPI